MLFNSYAFILVFLPCVLIVCYVLAKRSGALATVWLLVASIFFYGHWDPRFVGLLVASITANFVFGRMLAAATFSQSHRRWLLTLAVAANLALLGYFKYANFLLDATNQLFDTKAKLPEIALPLGISFYTFTQIAYLVDVYREPIKYGFLRYALFVTYFPHLIAGPILHHREMMPQFSAPGAFQVLAPNLAIGITIFSIGLFKKVVFADGISPYASPVFDSAAAGYVPNLLESWGGALAFGLQLYFDFSAYSDMAIGLSAMLGVRLPCNFLSPYKSISLIEFWRCWHISLSRFLRDYLYIGLGGNRRGATRRYANLFLTMVLGGLWHGAGWTFLVWGAVHGIGLVVNHGWRRLVSRLAPLPRVLESFGNATAFALTFIFVMAAWVLFRCNDLPSAILIYRGMAGMNGATIPPTWYIEFAESAEWLLRRDFPLPSAFKEWMAMYAAVINATVPHGLALTHGSGLLISKSQLLWIVVLLSIAWFMPNTRQIMARTKVYIDAVEPPSPTRLLWWTDGLWAFATALILTFAVISMDRVRSFLYFQF